MNYDTISHSQVARSLADVVKPFNTDSDIDALINRIGDARIVMLGEASHGTHEYYLWRSRISKRLIEEKGFSFIAVEGDWPDCYKLNRYIKGYADAGNSAKEILSSFNRWPTWMWANWEVIALAEWLRKNNEGLAVNKKAGFYGLDVYSLWESLEAIAKYLRYEDPATFRLTEEVMQCFEPYIVDEGRGYAHATYRNEVLYEDEVVSLLSEIRRNMPAYDTDREAVLNVEQNAIIALHAEQYYRTMVRSQSHSWNMRDNHMMDTLGNLLRFHGKNSKGIIWAHNTHVGDARATDMARDGMTNLGELVRENFAPNETCAIGFGSYRGKVTAARRWSAPMVQMNLPSAIEGSWEAILHGLGKKSLLLMTDLLKDDSLYSYHLGHRAVGVVYNPEVEQYGNYVPSVIPLRYDAFIYFDETHALHPLHIKPDGHQTPETYPWGM